MFSIAVLACGRVGGLEVVRGAGAGGLGRLDGEGGEVQPGIIISQHHIIITSCLQCDLIMHTSELVFLSDQEQESPPPT